jgi:tRNA dimethylallyltransferase
MRIARMLEDGLVEEVATLLETGVPPGCEAMSGLGYRETVAFLRGEIPTLERLAAEIGRNTRRLIRTQYNWFSLRDPAISWFDLDQVDPGAVETFVQEWLDG